MKINQSLIALIINSFNFLSLIILLILSFVLRGIFNNIPLDYITFSIIIIFIRIAYLTYVYFTKYIMIYDNYLISYSGLFIKTKQSYHFDKILQANIYRYPLLRLTASSKLIIETNDYLYSNIYLLLNISSTKKIKQKINKYHHHSSKEKTINSKYQVGLLSLLKYSITHTSLLRGLVFVLAIFAFIYVLYQQELIFFPGQDGINKYLDNIIKTLSIYGVIIILLFVYAIFNFISTCFRYYDFTIIENNDSLLIAHGFINRVHYRIFKQDINGIIYKQNFGDMLLNNYRIDLLVSGYTALDDDFEDDGSYSDRSILAIAINKKQANTLINNMLNEYSDFKKDNQIDKFLSMMMIIIIPILIGSFTIIWLVYFFNFNILYAIGSISLLLIILSLIYIMFTFNQSITINNGYLYGTSINLIKTTKKRLIIKKSKILAIQYNRSHLLINSYSNLPSNAHLELYFVNADVYDNLINTTR